MRIAAAALLGFLTTASPFAEPSPTTRLVVGEGLREPFAVDFDASGRMFIAEHAGNRVSIWAEGALTPLAMPFGGPHHLLRGPDDQIYVADTWNNAVRRVDPRTGAVTPFAGTGEKGFAGDGGRAIDARFGSLFAIDIRQNTLFIADLDNRRIRAVDLTTSLVADGAGNGDKGAPADGADAKTQPLVDPRAVAVDAAGQIYICEPRRSRAARCRHAGTRPHRRGHRRGRFDGDGGPAISARLRGPKHVSIDRDGTVLIADTENHVIRRYIPATGRIERVAGTGEKGAAGLGGPPTALQLNRPHGAYRHGPALYISDSDNHRIVAVE